MGRFAWTQNHHKQPSDGKHVLPDWFSKSSGEPSRQALAELVKEHNSPPGTTYTRSRTNTLISTLSQGHKSSSSHSSSSQRSRPSSRHDSFDGPDVHPGPPEKAGKTLLSKGSKIMRRQTSKFNVLASHASEDPSNNDSSPRSTGLQRVRSAGQMLNMHTRRATMKPQISGPFDFQHVSHTDQSQYQNLNKSTKVELVQSFNSLQASQQPRGDIQGITVADIQSTDASFEHRPSSPTFSIVPSLTDEISKPAPPPKDHLRLPSLGGDVRLSQSVENFSWPSRLSLLPGFEAGGFESGNIDSVDQVAAADDPITSFSFSTDEKAPEDQGRPSPHLASSAMLDKPLPEAPAIVHAVSTDDLSALLLKTSPLPEPPLHQKQMSAGTDSLHSVMTSPHRKSLIRPMQSVPADLAQYRQSRVPAQVLLSSTFVSTSDVLASPPRPGPVERRISVGLKTIDVDDWEDAIDYSWDHALENEDDDGLTMNATSSMSKSDILPQRSFPPTQSFASFAQRAPMHSRAMHHNAPQSSLRGLGINQADRYSAAFSPDMHVQTSQRESLRVPYPQRVSGSPISKSSSQESIILSIASSIISTNRSSNTSYGDLKHFSQHEAESPVLQTTSQDGSSSSVETVTTKLESHANATDQYEDDTIVELPDINHQRGASTSRVPYVPSRRSSMLPAAQSAVRQRSSTLQGRPKLNTRASYSLFPASRPNQPA
jgi:hypothetical protein